MSYQQQGSGSNHPAAWPELQPTASPTGWPTAVAPPAMHAPQQPAPAPMSAVTQGAVAVMPSPYYAPAQQAHVQGMPQHAMQGMVLSGAYGGAAHVAMGAPMPLRPPVRTASSRRDGAFALSVALFVLAVALSAVIANEVGTERAKKAPQPAAAAAPAPAATTA